MGANTGSRLKALSRNREAFFSSGRWTGEDANDPAGTAAYPDGLGVVVAHGTGTRLGRSGQPNTISGNTASGIDILGSTSTEIRSELIGTTFLGNVAIKGYTMDAIFRSFTFDGRPAVQFPYVGKYAPGERQP